MLFWVIFVLFVAVNIPSWALLKKFGALFFLGAFFCPSVFPSVLHGLGRKYSIVPTKLEGLLVSLALKPHFIPFEDISVAKFAFWDLDHSIIHIFALCGLPFSLQHDPRVFAPWESHGYFYFTLFIPFVPLPTRYTWGDMTAFPFHLQFPVETHGGGGDFFKDKEGAKRQIIALSYVKWLSFIVLKHISDLYKNSTHVNSYIMVPS